MYNNMIYQGNEKLKDNYIADAQTVKLMINDKVVYQRVMDSTPLPPPIRNTDLDIEFNTEKCIVQINNLNSSNEGYYKITKQVTSLSELNIDPNTVTSLDNAIGPDNQDSVITKVNKIPYFPNVNNMKSMFVNNLHLTHINLDGACGDKVTNCAMMFSENTNLTSINFGSFKLPMVNDMWMFMRNCQSLTSIDLSGVIDGRRITRIDDAFEGCTNLQTINLNGWHLDRLNVTNNNSCFYDCPDLKTIYLKHSDQSTIDKVRKLLDKSYLKQDVTIVTN